MGLQRKRCYDKRESVTALDFDILLSIEKSGVDRL